MISDAGYIQKLNKPDQTNSAIWINAWQFDRLRYQKCYIFYTISSDWAGGECFRILNNILIELGSITIPHWFIWCLYHDTHFCLYEYHFSVRVPFCIAYPWGPLESGYISKIHIHFSCLNLNLYQMLGAKGTGIQNHIILGHDYPSTVASLYMWISVRI